MKKITDCIDETFDYKKFKNVINGEVTGWIQWRKSVEEKMELVKKTPELYSKYITILETKLDEKKYESGFGTFIDRLIACIAVLVSISSMLVSGFVASQNLLGEFWANLSQKDIGYRSEIIDNLKETYNNMWVFPEKVAAGCLIIFLCIYLADIVFRVLDIKFEREWETKRTFYLYLYNEMKLE